VDRYIEGRKRSNPLEDLARAARDALEPRERGAPPDPRGPGITAWYLVGPSAGPFAARTMDTATRFTHAIAVRDVPTPAYPELMVPVRPLIQNLSAFDLEIVFAANAIYGDGIVVPAHTQWTPEGITGIPVAGFGASDVRVIEPTVVSVGPNGGVLVANDPGSPFRVGLDGTDNVVNDRRSFFREHVLIVTPDERDDPTILFTASLIELEADVDCRVAFNHVASWLPVRRGQRWRVPLFVQSVQRASATPLDIGTIRLHELGN
jgi:hypothetical protein